MNDEELRAFIGSPLQKAMEKNLRMRMAEFFSAFLTAKPEELLQLQAQAVAYWRMLREISLTAEDLTKLSQDETDLMEEARRASEKALERHLRDRQAEASRSLL